MAHCTAFYIGIDHTVRVVNTDDIWGPSDHPVVGGT